MDLKFSIVAQVVEAGWNRAKSLVEGIKNAFSGMSSAGVGAWRAIAAGASTAIGAIVAVGMAAHKVYTAMRDSYLSNLEQMEQGNLSFFQGVQTWQRKLEFAESKKTKARVAEDTWQELQQLELKKKQLMRRDGMDTRFENAGEGLQAMLDKKMFGGTGLTRDEMELKLLDLKIKKTKEFFALVQTKDVSKFGQSDIEGAMGGLQGQRDTQAAEIAGSATDQAVEAGVKAAEQATKKLAEATANYMANIGDDDAAKAVIKAVDDLKAAEQSRHDAWKAQAEERGAQAKKLFDDEAAASEELAATRKKNAGFGADIAGAARDFAYSQASPAEKVKMDKQRLAQLSKEFTATDGLGQFAKTPEERAGIAKEAFAVKGRIADAEADAKKTVEDEKKRAEEARKANAGKSLSVGDLFTNLYGQNIQRGPEQETADNTKQALEVLKEIAKKTGAAP